MENNRRKHSRFEPGNLSAIINLTQASSHEDIIIEGKVINLSYTGIKIKLKKAVPNNILLNKIKINLILPQSGIPISIHGAIKHFTGNTVCGMQFSENHPEHEVDGLMLECIKSSTS